MFSSNQVFEISGDLGQLESAIKFVVGFYGSGIDSFQITKDGKYCLGWGDHEGWTKFPFDFDSHIVSEIIKQHLKKQSMGEESEWEGCDGCTDEGVLMKCIPETFSDEENGIVNPFFGIVSIEPFEAFYSK